MLCCCWKICLPVISGHSRKNIDMPSSWNSKHFAGKCSDALRPLPWLLIENFYDPTWGIAVDARFPVAGTAVTHPVNPSFLWCRMDVATSIAWACGSTSDSDAPVSSCASGLVWKGEREPQHNENIYIYEALIGLLFPVVSGKYMRLWSQYISFGRSMTYLVHTFRLPGGLVLCYSLRMTDRLMSITMMPSYTIINYIINHVIKYHQLSSTI